MKMEMIISSPSDGQVKEVFVSDGENVDSSDLLVLLEDQVPVETKA